MKINLLLAGLALLGAAISAGARQWKDVDWRKMPVTYRCDEIAGMGHTSASAEVFTKALDWLESNPENTKPNKSKD